MEKLTEQRKSKDVSIIVLLSGGIDSAACVHYYLSQGFNTTGLFIDYGQLPAEREKSSAKQVASYYDIKLDIVGFSGRKYYQCGEIKGRNAIFILTALLLYPTLVGIISLGIHSGTPYYDCTETFVKDMKNVLNGYMDGKVRFDAPFLKWNKGMIYGYCKLNKIPVQLTYSCEVGIDEPCGKCASCKDRRALNVG